MLKIQNNLQKTLKLINVYSKVAGYKVNIQKSITFLYPVKNKLNLKLKTIPFTLAFPKIK